MTIKCFLKTMLLVGLCAGITCTWAQVPGGGQPNPGQQNPSTGGNVKRRAPEGKRKKRQAPDYDPVKTDKKLSIPFSDQAVEDFAAVIKKISPAQKRAADTVHKNIKKYKLTLNQYRQLKQLEQRMRDTIAGASNGQIDQLMRNKGYGSPLVQRYRKAKNANDKVHIRVKRELNQIINQSPLSRTKYKEMLKEYRVNDYFRNKVTRMNN